MTIAHKSNLSMKITKSNKNNKRKQIKNLKNKVMEV